MGRSPEGELSDYVHVQANAACERHAGIVNVVGQRCAIDTGAGMDEVTLAKAVEPFFSTKNVGKGTGLGVSMVHGLAAQLGGAFELQSNVGQGTRADLYRPVATAGGALAAARLPAASKPVRPLRLLLIDDEKLVRRGTGRCFANWAMRCTRPPGARRRWPDCGRASRSMPWYPTI